MAISEEDVVVTSKAGVPWRIHIVRPGDRHGRDDMLVYGADKVPTVEFYDMRGAVNVAEHMRGRGGLKSGTVPGWFAGDYYAFTIMEHRPGQPMQLSMGDTLTEDEREFWWLDGDTMDAIIAWMKTRLPPGEQMRTIFESKFRSPEPIVARAPAASRAPERKARAAPPSGDGRCSTCGHQNRPGKRSCGTCGAKL